MWAKKQIEDHLFASKKLVKIKDYVFNLIKIRKDISEEDIQKFILSSYKKEGLKSDSDLPIVAFNDNIAIPYSKYKASKSKKLKKNTLVLIDIWARKNSPKAPFADMSWVAYKGKTIPKKIDSEFNSTIKARNKVLEFIRKELKKSKIPSGKEVDDKSKEYLIKEGYNGKGFFTGHCLGTTSPHGTHGNLSKSNKNSLKFNLGYALEPGMYAPGKFWIRNEINFYISNKKKLILTTDMQKKITRV